MGQSEVDVAVYAIAESEPGPWDALDVRVEELDAEPVAAPHVQPAAPRVLPAPDGTVEAGWVRSGQPLDLLLV